MQYAPDTMHIEICNDEPWLDRDGRIIDAHEGNLRFFDGRFYYYGTRYGDTSGFTQYNRPVCYSSPDLSRGSWVNHGVITPDPPPGLIFRPYVARSPTTGKFVMYYKHHPGGTDSSTPKAAMAPPPNFVIAVADEPTGPFLTHTERFESMHETLRHGDQDLFVDDDGTPYLALTRWITDPQAPRFLLSVEQLTPDLLGSAGRCSDWIDRECEAPSMFKREGRYYVTCGNLCAFCPQGAGSRVYVADHPLGPYRFTRNINRTGGTNDGQIIIPGQETHVAQLATPDGPAYIQMYDLWESTPDGVKGHDFVYWTSPLQFDEDGVPDRVLHRGAQRRFPPQEVEGKSQAHPRRGGGGGGWLKPPILPRPSAPRR